MRRFALPLAAAVGLTAISVVTAFAHAGLEPAEAPPGSYRAVIRIPHGCDGQPTTTVRVAIPEGYVGVKPMLKPGWTIETVRGDYARSYSLHGRDVTTGVKEVVWSGGNLPDDQFDEFVLSGTLAGVETGQTLAFKTVQTCPDGEVAWIEEAAAGQDPHALEHPAPAVTILAATGTGHGHAGHGGAETVKAGTLEITGAWARAMLPGQPAGGGYLSVTNAGPDADRLMSASSPAAGRVEIHTMSVENDVMVMRPVEGGLEIPAGATVELKPGGLHLMFLEVSEPFAEDASVPVTLQFEKAGTVEVAFPVRAGKGGATEDHSQH